MAARLQHEHERCGYIGRWQTPEAELDAAKRALADARGRLGSSAGRPDHIVRLRQKLAASRCQVLRLAGWIRASRGDVGARRRLAWLLYLDRRRDDIDRTEWTIAELTTRIPKAEQSLQTGRLSTNPFKHLTRRGRTYLTSAVQKQMRTLEDSRAHLRMLAADPVMSYAEWRRDPERATREAETLTDRLPVPKPQCRPSPTAPASGQGRGRRGLVVLTGGRA